MEPDEKRYTVVVNYFDNLYPTKMKNVVGFTYEDDLYFFFLHTKDFPDEVNRFVVNPKHPNVQSIEIERTK